MSKSEDFKISFTSDNNSGVIPEVMEKLVEVNLGHMPAYGGESVTKKALKVLKQNFGDSTKAFFVFNGTAANVCALQALARRYESVICTEHSHIHKDECGAPEAIAGLKLILCEAKDAKLKLSEVKTKLIRKGDQHCSQPRVISITQPTELGTLYTREEILEITSFAKENQLFVHMDGSRLVNAAASQNLSLQQSSFDLGIDVLSLGGTKNGLMLGEAVIFANKDLAKDFQYIRKQNLQLAGKMRFISIQFDAWLSNEAWLNYAKHANSMAQKLEAQLLPIKSIVITQKVETNVVFAKIPETWIKEIRKDYFFYIWDELTFECRLMTSFDTKESDVLGFSNRLKAISKKF